MRQRLLPVFPRVRSNSLSTLSVVVTPPRLPNDAPKHSPQLALPQPLPLHPPLFPSYPFSPPVPSPVTPSFPSTPSDPPRAPNRQRLHYQLDVGAYGIPKHRHHSRVSPTTNYPHTALSVQVGEDAYFVRDNAMGIADGVGGWARSTHHHPHHPTPSALFSRRLMHFCAAELDSHPRPSTAQFSFQHHHKPTQPPTDFPFNDLQHSLHASLEDLSDGIDVLNILERAYDSTVKSHITLSTPFPTPLTTGSSTALLAVLDHPGPLSQSPEPPEQNYAKGSIYEPTPNPSDTDHEHHAVLRIAHLGDCMGMLVRGDKIAWRSDEMWWGYNHPLQLAPPSSSTPSTTTTTATTTTLPLPVQPHTFTLPVLADDILILASDGLSDNLWDEDVLDEVLKFRKQAGWSSSETYTSQEQPQEEQPVLQALATLDIAPSTRNNTSLLKRKAFAGMLSEALCSRAKRVSELKGTPPAGLTTTSTINNPKKPIARKPRFSLIPEEDHSTAATDNISLVMSSSSSSPTPSSNVPKANPINANANQHMSSDTNTNTLEPGEIPFARRAKLSGRHFRGGKVDDISVIVAVISPCPPAPKSAATSTSTSAERSPTNPPTQAQGSVVGPTPQALTMVQTQTQTKWTRTPAQAPATHL